MPKNFVTKSLRQVLPRQEIRAIDRRSGAYPVKSKTGDASRTGRNKIYFDDARTILFLSGVNITYPTTQQNDPNRLYGDLTSSLGTVVGNVNANAVDQFVPNFDQSENVVPFDESRMIEQDETNVVNSKFMTGAAFFTSPDRFKSKLSNKTAIRMQFTLKNSSPLSSNSSSLHYLNPTNGTFDKIADELSLVISPAPLPGAFAPIPFTPYGMHYLPIADKIGGGLGSFVLNNADVSYRRITSYAGDGSDAPFFDANNTFYTNYVTASLLNPRHTAATSHSLDMSNYLSSPFLVEKIVVEFPFQAGPGWLNDRFGIREALQDDLTYVMDCGGPMITFAVMRQDGTRNGNRDLIASGTFTCRNDMVTGVYKVITSSYAGVGGYDDIVASPEGVGYFINPSVVITGSTLSGSNNQYTGSVKLIMDPQITSHVWRIRGSGSAAFYLGLGTTQASRPTQGIGVAFGPVTKRSAKYMEAGRGILGNEFALIPQSMLNTTTNPVVGFDNQYENGFTKNTAPRIYNSKIYTDVESATVKHPYVLYPQDKLVFCLSKHRAVGPENPNKWSFNLSPGDLSTPKELVSYHDALIPTGSIKITLYGDLIKQDTEFHDTLNQRLETEEIWEDIGLEPVLDQYDVFYKEELSGSYVDRFNVNNALRMNSFGLSSSLETTSYYSNFSSDVNASTPWSTQYEWSKARNVDELKKNNKNVNFFSMNEKFWDCRVPDPFEIAANVNPNYRLAGYDTGVGISTMSFVMYTGDALYAHQTTPRESGRGIRDWMMSYPYEKRYSSITEKFSDALTREFVPRKEPPDASTVYGFVPYNAITMEIGHSGSLGAFRMFGCEPNASTSPNKVGLSTPEFIKTFYGIGNGNSNVDNQHVTFRRGSQAVSQSVVVRGWKYGLYSAFPVRSSAVFRRDRFGQPRDMLEQRLDTKYYDELGLSPDGNQNGIVGVKEGPVQVRFYDSRGNQTDPSKTLSSNLSFEATSSCPYTDGIARNRNEYELDMLNILNVIV